MSATPHFGLYPVNTNGHASEFNIQRDGVLRHLVSSTTDVVHTAKTPTYSSQPSFRSYSDTQRSPTLASTGTGAYLTATHDWFRGLICAERTLMLVYNPNRDNGITSLVDRSGGLAPGIGVYRIELLSDVVSPVLAVQTIMTYQFTISASVRLHLVLSSLSPKTTVYQVKLVFVQNTSLVSPRDGKTIQTSESFDIITQGRLPSRAPATTVSPTLWRGTDRSRRSREDIEDFVFDGSGRIPSDMVARPTTLPGSVPSCRTERRLTIVTA
jgi:hypothetical protein